MICVLCLKELFSVKDISVVYTVTSQDGAEEVLSLLEKYKGESIFLIDSNEIREEITSNRYLKVISVERKYPNELVINLEERAEKYYYQAEDGVYYFDEEYFVVRKSAVPENCELLTQFVFTDLNGNNVYADCQLKSVFTFPNELNDDVNDCIAEFGDSGDNIQQIGIVFTAEEGNYRVRFNMTEGVIIEIRNANTNLTAKVEEGVKCYLSLEEARKIDGVVVVDSLADGRVNATHTFNG